MATITLGMPTFSGDEGEDIDIFVGLFRGYLNALGIDFNDAGTSDRCLGILRACLKGEAAHWYDRTLLDKYWSLHNLYNNHGQDDLDHIRGRTMVQLRTSNSIRAGTAAHTYASNNDAVILSRAGSDTIPAADDLHYWIPLHRFNQDWSMLDGRPVDIENRIANPGNANPITLGPIRIGGAIYYLRTHYPTVLDARRKLRFSNLFQENLPVRTFYDNVIKSARLLKLPQSIIEDQFFKGLTPESQLEAERIGFDRPFADLIDALEKVEKRKNVIRMGHFEKSSKERIQSQDVVPIQIPQVSPQEPVVLKPEQFTLDEVNNMIQNTVNKITEQFQSEIRTLHDRLATSQQTSQQQTSQQQIPQAVMTEEEELIPKLKYPSRNELLKRHVQDLRKNYNDHPFDRAVKVVNRYFEKEEERKLDDEMAKIFNKLNLRDPDDMDTTNLVRGKNIELDNDEVISINIGKKKTE